MTDFIEKLTNSVHNNNSLVCIGLDIDKEKIPSFLFETTDDPFVKFTTSIIKETKDLVCAYKPNLAFFEALGEQGEQVLRRTLAAIPKDIIIILDGKRNDIGNTAKKYAYSLFEDLKADGATVNPYLGLDGVKPFLEYADKCSFLLCRTSNPSAKDFQDLRIDDEPLYIHVAKTVKSWKNYGCCGLVAGATYPEELRTLRQLMGDDTPFLIPGIGKQGGDVKKTVTYGTNSHGEMAVINSSRGIIYASDDEDFAQKARQETLALQETINTYR
ncbi:MAG: orotidine-5'-phosphate decarboxylase [Candidatus Thermoplasmatota archaeon]|nr:orotidine-5'-phosphate decarboxylase [Candidatus Thermoplasmatota archaeon]